MNPALLGLAAPLAAAICLAASAHLLLGGGDWRVVGAQIRRQALAVASYRFKILVGTFNFVLVIVLVAIVGRNFLSSALEGLLEGSAGDAIRYLVVGLVAWPTVWVGYQASASTIRREQVLGTFEIVAATPTGVGVLPFAALVTESVKTLGGAMVVFGLVLFVLPLPIHVTAWMVPITLSTLILGAIVLWGVGLVFGALTIYYKELGGIEAFLRFGLILLSGVYFPLDILPKWIAAAGHALPISVAFDVVRQSLEGALPAAYLLPRIGLLAGSALVSVYAGKRVLDRALRRSRRTGVLHGY